MNYCDLCSNSITSSTCLSAIEGCKHDIICTSCISQILREKAVGSCMVCPMNDCPGKFDVENARYDAVVTPERVSLNNDLCPDFVSSLQTAEFDENEYAILRERYLAEYIPGDKKRKSLNRESLFFQEIYTSYKNHDHNQIFQLLFRRRDYDELLQRYLNKNNNNGKKSYPMIESLINEGNHFKAYEMLSQLRDYEMNPKKVPSFLRGTYVNDEIVEVIDLSKDDDHTHVDVEKDCYEPLFVHAKKRRILLDAGECSVEDKLKVKTEVEEVVSMPGTRHAFNDAMGANRLLPAVETVYSEQSLVKKEIKIEQQDGSDDESRFSMGCTAIDNGHTYGGDDDSCHSNSRVESSPLENSRYCSDDLLEGTGNLPNSECNDDECQATLSQEEIDAAKKEKAMKKRAKERKYGARYLLGRQTSDQLEVEDQHGIVTQKKINTGMMKLGGGNQMPDMYWHKEEDRLKIFTEEFPFRKCLALNGSWNFLGPDYAGQVHAAISHPVPSDGYDKSFSIFMKRVNNKNKLLGWEYVGEYLAVDHGIEGMYLSPTVQRDKEFVIRNLKTNLKLPTSWVHECVARCRSEIKHVLTRQPGSGEAAELRMLGLDNEHIGDHEFVEKVVDWQGFLHHTSVKFIRYDENMYKFVSDGLTTRDKDGNSRKDSRKPPAKASDWYNELDQKVE